LKSALHHFNLKLNNLSGVVTDGAPQWWVGKDKGLAVLIRKEAGVSETGQFMHTHNFKGI
jgi:ligand-binding sensor domain-containing protein